MNGIETELSREEIAEWKTLNLWMLNIRSSVVFWRDDLMQRYEMSPQESNRLILDSMLVKGSDLSWAE